MSEQQQNRDSNVNASSLIDLKAELFRKQEEFKRQKLQSQNSAFIKGKTSTSKKKKRDIWSKKNAGVSQRAAKDYEEKLEEEDIFEKSKKCLENKAKLYEKISGGAEVPEEDGSGLYLVDFQKKVIDGVFEERDRARQEEEEREKREIEEEKQQLREPVPEPANEEEEWVDFMDSFGRSRRCLKKDLPDLQRQDEALKERKEKKRAAMAALSKDFDSLRDKSESSGNTLMSEDMRRELARQEWEKKELETMEEEKSGPVHYSDVRHNEIRTHGVGFYQFDKDETARQEQLQELHTLRDETITERSKKDRIKEKRKAALEARLAKVKQRRKIKTGDPDEEPETKSNEEIGPKIEEKSDTVVDAALEQTEKSIAQTEPKPVPKIREWDIGKERLLERSEASWLEKQRAERFEEFAPPQEYYDSPKQVQQNSRPLHKNWGQGSKSVFSKINKIKLGTDSSAKNKEVEQSIPNDSNTSSFHRNNVCDENRPAENSRIEKSTSVQTSTTDKNIQSDNVEETEPQSVMQGQSTEVPVGFDPSVPPPSFMQQPSWFPQQQPGIAASQEFNQINQPIEAHYPQHSDVLYQNVISMNTNPSVTGSGNILGAQGLMGMQTGSSSVDYSHLTGSPPVPQGSVPLTNTQSNNPMSSDFTHYTNTLPTSYTQGNVGVQSWVASQTSMQPVAETKPKIVIPKMKIIDTRLMQNEDD